MNPLPQEVLAARQWAIEAHGDQRYGDHPYVYHLDAVVAHLEPYGPQAQIAGYLHDVIEDTDRTQAEVEASFGATVGRAVALLTDAEGPNRKTRKALTYARMGALGPEDGLALIVKTADRLANLIQCTTTKNKGLTRMYRKEHPAFRAAVYRAGLCDPLWERIDQIMG